MGQGQVLAHFQVQVCGEQGRDREDTKLVMDLLWARHWVKSVEMLSYLMLTPIY